MANSNSWLTPGNILIVGAMAGGGYLLYRVFKNGSLISVTQPEPSMDWENVNSILDKIESGDQQLMDSLSSLLDGVKLPSTTTTPSDQGTTTPSDDGTTLPDSTDQANNFLEEVNQALDQLGYSGFWAQHSALNKADHDENVAEVYESGGAAAALESATQWIDNNDPIPAGVPGGISTVTNLFKPSTWKDGIDNWKNFGKSLGDWWGRVTS